MTGLFKLARNTTKVQALLIDRAITIACVVHPKTTLQEARALTDTITHDVWKQRGRNVNVRVKFHYIGRSRTPSYTIPTGADNATTE